MARTTTAALAQKALLVSAAALTASLIGTSGAWAQCRDNFAITVPGGGPIPAVFAGVPISQLFPLGGGSSISALSSTINTVNTAFLTSTSAFVSAPGNPQPDQQGGGAWGRIISGTVDTNSTSTGTLSLVGLGTTGAQTCNTSSKQDYWGYQVGHDISILNGGGSGANWHFGVTAGYIEARSKDTTPAGQFVNPNLPGTTFFTPGGAFGADAQVPFVGLYTAFTKGNFFLDGQARWDFFQNTLTDPSNGLFGQQLGARGFSLTGNVGYNIPLGSGWFLEPGGGVVWSRVAVDPLLVPGVSTNFGQLAAGRVVVDDIESVLGRFSLRVGTNFTSGGMAWQPFFTASVFHEFAGDVTARALGASNQGIFLIDGDSLTIRSEGGLGTYGQFALGTAATILNTGWLGYARVDYRIGENIEGWSANAGLRYQFSPEQRASVKDGGTPLLAYNWTGPYIGVFAGAVAWGDEDWRYVVNNARVDDLRFAGYFAGGQIGYNLQSGRTVIGIEGDLGWTNAHGGRPCPNAFFFTCEVHQDYLATLTGRLGYTWGRALFYAKGGLAVGEVSLKTKQNQNAPVAPSNTPVNGSTETLVGWTAGGGMEFALTDRWSAKAEYMYYDLGGETFVVDNGLRVDGETRGSTVRIGVNLHFHPRAEERPLK